MFNELLITRHGNKKAHQYEDYLLNKDSVGVYGNVFNTYNNNKISQYNSISWLLSRYMLKLP